jgi:hypothetical protein
LTLLTQNKSTKPFALHPGYTSLIQPTPERQCLFILLPRGGKQRLVSK